jgi:hypothetical protein
MLDDTSTPLLDAANAKLVNPSLNCADIGGAVANYAAAAGGEADVETEYYPHYDSSTCLSDGLAPSWLQNSEIFNNVNDCCTNNFPWNTDCVAQSTPVTGTVFYPDKGSYQCKSDGKQPPYMGAEQLFKNEEDCCKFHFSWIAVEDCISNGIIAATATTTTSSSATTTTASTSSSTTTTASTSSSTATTTTASTTTNAGTTTTTTRASTTTTTKATADQLIPVEAAVDQPIIPSDQSTLFFPLFESGITKCQNEGTPSSWLSVNDFKGTLSECCRSYASNYDDCMTASSATNERYYPDFETMSCLSEKEGTAGDWMTDDYFRWTEKRCCRSFFATAQSSTCSDLL